MNAAAGLVILPVRHLPSESNDNGQVFQHYSERIGIDGKIQGLNNAVSYTQVECSIWEWNTAQKVWILLSMGHIMFRFQMSIEAGLNT